MRRRESRGGHGKDVISGWLHKPVKVSFAPLPGYGPPFTTLSIQSAFPKVGSTSKSCRNYEGSSKTYPQTHPRCLSTVVSPHPSSNRNKFSRKTRSECSQRHVSSIRQQCPPRKVNCTSSHSSRATHSYLDICRETANLLINSSTNSTSSHPTMILQRNQLS